MAINNPLISICIPTCNRAHYLKKCIESVIGYQGDDIEIIIQDNDSTDNTKEVVISYNDKRLKYYKNSKNIGSIWNCINIITRARGQYIYFLTDDDMLLPGSIDIIKEYIFTCNEQNAFKTDLIIYFEKTKRCSLSSYFKVNKYSNNVSSKDIANIFFSAHILTGLCFEKEKLDYEFLKEYGDNWYPSMLLIGLMNKNVGYLAQPTAIHIWENKTFWGIDPGNKEELYKGKLNIINALEHKIDKEIFKEMVKLFMINNQIIERTLLHFLNKDELIKIKLIIIKQKFKNRIIRMFKMFFNFFLK